jgi:large subunit ribosomal protein L6
MSRIGNAAIVIPQGVEVTISDKNEVTVKGPKGTMVQKVDSAITVKNEAGQLVFTRATDQKRHKAFHGLYRALIASHIKGVNEGFKVVQELVGVGYRATATGQMLELSLGFSHNVSFEIPAEVKVTTETVKGKSPSVILESINKQLVGSVAAKLRSLRSPEPYKGKGIRFQGEELRRKAGKSAGK